MLLRLEKSWLVRMLMGVIEKRLRNRLLKKVMGCNRVERGAGIAVGPAHPGKRKESLTL